jgi:hypothetical protein
MGLLDSIFGGGQPQPAQAAPAQPYGLLGPVPDDFESRYRLAQMFKGFGKGVSTGIGGLLDPAAPIAAYYGLQKGGMDNAMTGLDLANSVQRAQMAGGIPQGRTPGAQIGSAMMQPQMPSPVVPIGAPGAPGDGAAGLPQAPMGAPPSPATAGWLLSPQTLLSQINQSWGPSASKNIPAYLKTLETLVNNGTGVTGNGDISVLPGADTSKLTMSHADKLGGVLAENNKDQVVPPGAQVLSGPRTMDEYRKSLGGRGPAGSLGVYTNPNSPALVNMQNNAEPEYLKNLAADMVKERRTLLGNAENAQKSDAALAQFEQAMNEAKMKGTTSGYFTPALAQVAAMAKSAGINTKLPGLPDPEAVADVQTANKVSKGLMGEILKSMYPQRITNTDILINKGIAPGADIDERANANLVNAIRAQNQYDKLKAKEALNFEARTKNLFGFEQEFTSKYGHGPLAFQYNSSDGNTSPSISAPLENMTNDAIAAELKRRGLSK